MDCQRGNRMVKYAIIFLFGVFIASIAQVLLKKSALKKYSSVCKDYLNLMVVGAYFLMAISMMISVMAYKGIPLSMGPLLDAAGYIFIMFFGVKVFKEKISVEKIIALTFILAGIFVYSFCGLNVMV